MIGAGQDERSSDELLQLSFGRRSALLDTPDNELLRQQNLAHPPHVQDEIRSLVDTAGMGGPNEQLALNQAGEGCVALRHIGTYRKVSRLGLIVQFGERDFYTVDNGNYLPGRLSGSAGA